MQTKIKADFMLVDMAGALKCVLCSHVIQLPVQPQPAQTLNSFMKQVIWVCVSDTERWQTGVGGVRTKQVTSQQGGLWSPCWAPCTPLHARDGHVHA